MGYTSTRQGETGMSQSQIEYPTDLHAPGAIDQLIAFHKQTFGGSVMEESGAGGGGEGGGGEGGGAGEDTGGQSGEGGNNDDGDTGASGDGGDDGKDLGFPKDKPVAEMTVEQRAAYWEHHSKKHEARAKGLSKLTGGKTAEQIRAEQNELEELRRGKLSDSERAVDDAKKEARAEALREVAVERVKDKFELALAHVTDEKRRDQIIEGINLSSYLTDDGRVDADKVKSYAQIVAPVDTTTTRRRDFGAGHREEGHQAASAKGKAEADRRFKKTQTTTGA